MQPQFSAEDEGPLRKTLTRLYRRIDAAERSYYHALKELQAKIAAHAETEAEAEAGVATAPSASRSKALCRRLPVTHTRESSPSAGAPALIAAIRRPPTWP
jgi:hypothetical protein